MKTTTAAPEGLTTPWLATRLGMQPAAIESLRRAGALVGIRRPDGQHVYPAWQFGRDCKPLAVVPRLVEAARAAGIDELRLHQILTARNGLTGEGELADSLREGGGGAERVLLAIASAA